MEVLCLGILILTASKSLVLILLFFVPGLLQTRVWNPSVHTRQGSKTDEFSLVQRRLVIDRKWRFFEKGKSKEEVKAEEVERLMSVCSLHGP